MALLRILTRITSHYYFFEMGWWMVRSLSREQHHILTYFYSLTFVSLRITATHCNVFATHYNLQHHIPTHSYYPYYYLFLQHTATHYKPQYQIPTYSHTFLFVLLLVTTTHCNTLQHTATHCNTLQHASPTLTATPLTQAASHTHYCNTRHTLQHTATHLSHTSSHPSHTSSITF